MNWKLTTSFLVVLTIMAFGVQGQTNLVSNNSLETFSSCPTGLSQITNATGWGQPTLHIGSSDYFNACATSTICDVPVNVFGTTTFAAQGNAYAGGYTYVASLSTYREYVVATLTSPLVSGQSYVVSFNYARAPNTRYASDAYGFYLSSSWPSNGTSGNGALPVTPTSLNPSGNYLSSTSWQTYADTIIASGGEQYLTIGSFTQLASAILVGNSGISGAYMYVDNASIIVYNGIFGDSNICLGDTAQIYAIADTSFYWVDSTTNTTISTTADTIWVAPTQNNTYWAITPLDDTFRFEVQVHNPPTNFVGPDTVVCEDDTITRIVNLPSHYSLSWSDGGTDSALITNQGGYHTLEVSIYGCVVADSFEVTYFDFPDYTLPNDTVICHYDNLNVSTGLVNTQYLFVWNTGSTNPTINVIDSGQYIVAVTNNYCTYSDTINVSYHDELSVDLGFDSVFCYKNSAPIIPDSYSANATQFSWSNGSQTSQTTVSQSGTYTLTVSNGFCIATDEVEYSLYHEPIADLGPDTSFCHNESLTLNTKLDNTIDFLWSDNSGQPTLITNQPGLYWVEVSNQYCAQRDSIYIDLYPILDITLGEDRHLCEGITLELTPQSTIPLSTFNWSTGTTAPSITVNEHGTYMVSATDGICNASDEVNVFYYKRPEFDLGKDTLLCPGDEITLDASVDGETIDYKWDDGSSSSKNTFTGMRSGRLVWAQATNVACVSKDSIVLGLREVPSADLGNDTSICAGDKIILSTPENPSIQTHVWSMGDTTATLEVGAPGEYEVVVFDGYCSNTGRVNIKHRPQPTAEDLNLDLPETICVGEQFTANVDHPYFNSYQWQDGSTASSYTVDSEGLYWVKAFHDCGVIADSVLIERCECPVWLPNAFRPDGDDLNDRFAPSIDCDVIEYRFTVYNRWGKELFTSEDPTQSWDGTLNGKPVQMGPYAWTLFTLSVHEGQEVSETRNGVVNIIR